MVTRLHYARPLLKLLKCQGWQCGNWPRASDWMGETALIRRFDPTCRLKVGVLNIYLPYTEEGRAASGCPPCNTRFPFETGREWKHTWRGRG